MHSPISPGKQIRTRFKLPGEGPYTLSAELHAPLPRHVAAPASNPSNKSAGTTTTPPPPPAGPLGLASVSSISFVPGAQLADPPSSSASAVSATTTASVASNATGGSAASSSGSMFSLRKLTGLGSSISSKFGAAASGANNATNDAPAAGSAAGGTAEEAAASSSRAWLSSVVSAAPASASASASDPAARAPAHVSRPEAVARGSASQSTNSRSGSDAQDVIDTDGDSSRPTAGVLIVKASDCVLALDVPRFTLPAAAGAETKQFESTMELRFRSRPTAQAVFRGEKLQMLVGCVNGEVVYYPSVSAGAAGGDAGGKRARGTSTGSAAGTAGGGSTPAYFIYNRDGGSNGSRVVAVRWVPGSGGVRFIAVHVDGAIAVYDTRYKPHVNAFRSGPVVAASAEGGDASAAGGSTSNAGTSGSSGLSLRTGADKVAAAGDKSEPGRERDKAGGNAGGNGGNAAGADKPAAPSHRRGAGSSGSALAVGQHEVSIVHATRRKSNPVALWQVGSGILTDAVFAPGSTKDNLLLAVTGRDGYLRVLDFLRETSLAAFRSYFGAFLCVAWSPDGRFIATGGEDDLVSVWCPTHNRIIARLEGHTSWVSSVAWDASVVGPARYRIASTGHDTKLLLWDFDVDMLHIRSHARVGTNMVRLQSYGRESVVASADRPSTTHGGERHGRTGKLARLRGSSGKDAGNGGGVDGDGGTVSSTPVVVRAVGRKEVPVVGPVVSHVAHAEPLTDVSFESFGIVTADSTGVVRVWTRPVVSEVPGINLADAGVLETSAVSGRTRTQKSTDLD